MKIPKSVEFPEVSNAHINVALTADVLNQVIAFLGEKFPEENVFNGDGDILLPPGEMEWFTPGTVTGTFDININRLKPGVRVLKNGNFMLNGKFIKKEEAYL